MLLKEDLIQEIENLRINQESMMKDYEDSKGEKTLQEEQIIQSHVLIEGTLRLVFGNIINLFDDIGKGMSEEVKSQRLVEMQDNLIKYSGHLADTLMKIKRLKGSVFISEEKLNSYIESIEKKDELLDKIMIHITN